MSEEMRDKPVLYQATNRTTGEKRLVVATSTEDALALLGWEEGDCYIGFCHTLAGEYHNKRRYDLVAVPCKTCPYQYAECGKPEGIECPVTSDVPDLNKWLQKISLAHLCEFVGEDIDAIYHHLRQKLIPFEEALKELTPKP